MTVCVGGWIWKIKAPLREKQTDEWGTRVFSLKANDETGRGKRENRGTVKAGVKVLRVGGTKGGWTSFWRRQVAGLTCVKGSKSKNAVVHSWIHGPHRVKATSGRAKGPGFWPGLTHGHGKQAFTMWETQFCRWKVSRTTRCQKLAWGDSNCGEVS